MDGKELALIRNDLQHLEESVARVDATLKDHLAWADKQKGLLEGQIDSKLIACHERISRHHELQQEQVFALQKEMNKETSNCRERHAFLSGRSVAYAAIGVLILQLLGLAISAWSAMKPAVTEAPVLEPRLEAIEKKLDQMQHTP